MRVSASHRRAFTITLVLIVMTVVVGALVILSRFSAAYYQTHQADRVRLTARVIADSVADYARAQAPRWRDHRPTEPISVDIASMLPANAEGNAVITFPVGNESSSCHIAVRINRGRYQAADEVDIELPRAQASRPAATGTE